MIIRARRPGISQSLDLFIIIGAVLAVGGVVASAATGLIGSATSTPSLQLLSYTLAGSNACGTCGGPASLSLTMKNAGSSTVTIGSSFAVIVATNSMSTTTSTACTTTGSAPASYAGSAPVSWTFSTSPSATCNASGGTINAFKWVPSSAVTLAPGQQVTFAVTLTFTSSTLPNPITSGSTYQLTILGAGQSILQNVISQ
jgi:hypothetical protein